MPRNANTLAVAVAAAALAGGGAGAAAVALSHGSSQHSAAPPAPVATSSANNVAATSTLTLGQIAKQSTKSVVEVDATSTGSQSPYPYGGGGGGGGTESATGTGFVYDGDGHIVTNEHVIDGASSVSVKLSDGSTWKATVVGSDTSSDLAVLRISAPASKLTPLPLADSSAVQVGDGVVAIGNPFGLDGTVTSGIISAVDREIAAPDETPIEGAIQTDAAINHGNSGGPLLNLEGKVIGVTAQIQSESGGNDGVGFAIPSNTVRSIADQLIATGKAQHALLGVNVKTALNGVAIASVESGSGANAAGLKVGDVITGVDGASVTTAERLRAVIAAHAPGDKLSLALLRGGKTQTVTVTLGVRS
ncbi:MAG: trypsin-like peptidase domain-containing protein [Gaiellaceae bacterium]